MRIISIALLLIVGACREVPPYHTYIEQDVHLTIIYYRPPVARGDTLIWYSATAYVFAEGEQLLKLNNGGAWNGVVGNGVRLLGLYWQMHQIGGTQTTAEVHRAITVFRDTTWML